MSEFTMPKVYSPQDIEEGWYKHWEENNYFAPSGDKSKPSFCIVMPPPNVTGKLHMGHALDNVMQDILVRYKRMQGLNTLWIPGTDHAGIATQAKVEEKLRKEGRDKYEVGREAFIQECWDWKNEFGDTITQQLRKLGTSCDWNYERFTMDEGCSKAVREAFVKLYEDGLIYQGTYIVNWCPHCHTTISDIEVEHEETDSKLYYLNYFLEDGSKALTIATTRPETMFGDTAVAVHPEDERFKDFIGKKVVLPIVDRAIPVITDEYVDKEFGTGAVKITPAHDPNDFEIGQRHQLEQLIVMNEDGTMNEAAGPYEGLDRFACRDAMIRDLTGTPYLEKVEDYQNAVGHCYRCDTVIEPRASKQWFVKMAPLAKPALEAVKNGDIRFVPERFTKIYTAWLENIRDWCISRQLWWGHRVPVWYCDDCGEVICTRETPEVCPSCGSSHLRQDEDVLDTWFSSGLWPFETLGWPDETEDLKTYYPTDVLVTGRDIIFFWVARMIFDALYFTGERPFKDVLIHGLVLDDQGRKMSKSLGNGIDPLEEIERYGVDALRLTLITGTTPGNDTRYRQEKIEASRNFTNKLWNAARFVLMNLEDYEGDATEPAQEDIVDRWIVSRLYATQSEVTAYLERYELGEAARAVHDFIWDELCDWYIEMAKPRLYSDDLAKKRAAQDTLAYVLREAVQILHPFAPFITEEIWQRLPHQGDTIMWSEWPEIDDAKRDMAAEEAMGFVMELVRDVRALRRDMNIPLGQKVRLAIHFKTPEQAKIFDDVEHVTLPLLSASEMARELSAEDEKHAVSAVVQGAEVFLPLKGVIDIEKEIARLEKDMAKLEKEEKQLNGKLSNSGFLNKAPAEVVEKEKNRLSAVLTDKDMLHKRIESFRQMIS